MALTIAGNDGVWQYDGEELRRLGLDGKRVTHVAERDGVVLAALPGDGIWRIDADGERKLWDGDAHSCAIAPDGAYFVGSEPAMIHRSRDGGDTWTRLDDIDALPTRPEWTFPPPPHEPHVLSIDFPNGDGRTIVAGIEVGGVIRSDDGGDTWRECNEGIYVDVHSLRPHPADPQRLFAVTGAGFYASEDAGEHWERRMEGVGRGYTIGLSVDQGGELLLTVTDGPMGENGRIFQSADGGHTWEQLEGDPLPDAPRRAAVPLHLDGDAWLGAYDGRLLRRNGGWEEVAALPAAINTLAGAGRSSSVMH